MRLTRATCPTGMGYLTLIDLSHKLLNFRLFLGFIVLKERLPKNTLSMS